MFKCLKKFFTCAKEKCNNSASDDYLKELQYFSKTKQCPCYSFWLPFFALLFLTILMSVPLVFIYLKNCCFCCSKWPLILFCFGGAIILLLAIIFIFKYLVPYWEKIAEQNDKYRERLIRVAEDRLDFENLPKKTAIEIMARQAKANIENESKQINTNS